MMSHIQFSRRPSAAVTGVRPAQLVSVQLLRAVAALLVVVAHSSYDADTIAARLQRPPLHLFGVFDWTFGIHIFFVVSGFIMIHTTPGFGTPKAWRSFMVRRLVRVAPLYWLMTTLLLIGAWFLPRLLNTPVDSLAVIVGSYLFIPVLRANGEVRPVVGQGWTLNYEMFFYAAFALATLLPRRLGVLSLSAGFTILVALGRSFQPASAQLSTWTDPLLFEFLFGVVIGLAYGRGWRVPASLALVLIATGVLLAVVLDPARSAFPGVPQLLRSGATAALIVAGAVLGPAVSAAWPIGVLAAIGDASYSLYLTHPFTIRPLRDLWTFRVGAALPLTGYFVVATLAAVVVSLGVFRWVERPITAGLQRRLRQRAGAGNPG